MYDPNAHMVPWDAIVPFFVALALAGFAGMLDLYRHQRCPHCEHCRRKDQEEQQHKDEAVHRNYHMWLGSSVSQCQDIRCKGRKKK